ncbi:hypothetical protein A1O1_07059 [Capronia coronata CBS 617.96]|uniref:Uncharacterized protein n=1 Tax=Capronia coronata CBS 617.96 TaxID=1182541 RepID=W9Y2I8_9EURO|nr:uncharacterized protein A1O1_07059 [Capronia coronata CBS 617.96]EXJ83436.1 hypothetical protein A1O1_07059 [Capronia coronata CBS 617.96]
MGLRMKLRKTFSSSASKKNSDPAPPLMPNEPHYTGRTDIEYYKPHEIPKSKYKGKVDPAHQASLAAFSLSDAFSAPPRRASQAPSGTFSPGGTQAQSLAPSRAQSRAASRDPSRSPSRRRSFHDQRRSNLRTETGVDSDESGSSHSTSREKSMSASTVLDHDTASTSLSDQPTAISSAPLEHDVKLVDSGIGIPSIVLSKQMTAHDTPFTIEELEQAMTRASLRRRQFDVNHHNDGVVS